MAKKAKLPKLGFLYLDYVLRFFDKSNFKGWPDRIEVVTYHWGNDKARFIREVKKKKIDILIGNIPATAYETFRDIARELPNVKFVPSMDTQYSNKSKENVTRFCEKYDIPIPKTHIIYDPNKANEFLKSTKYPKIIKRSYGPSNYGGYFVHKVDSYKEAADLMNAKKYHPLYIQNFVPMEADIRVMLIGHKPVCAFWRRPPEGEWLTNTSQGGSMDYTGVPKAVLDLAVKVSKAANAEYWACDIAAGKDGKYRILECATAFAAFPYIRDWIGQYLMWKFSNGRFKKPNIPMFSWEELGKIDSSLLRTMRHIAFGKYSPSSDGEFFITPEDENYPMAGTKFKKGEEWPSEAWNFQDRYKIVTKKKKEVIVAKKSDDDESSEETTTCKEKCEEFSLSKKEWVEFFKEVKGVGKTLANEIVETFKKKELLEILNKTPEKLEEVKGLKSKKIEKIREHWLEFIAK